MIFSEFVQTKIVNTDKGILGYFDEFYDALLSPRKETANNILEIGVQGGGSIALWKDFFTTAQIYGIDIDAVGAKFLQEPRVTFIQDNAYSKKVSESFVDEFFDVIIDDGPHTYESMVYFLQNYLCKVKSGGVLILEDVIDKIWTPKLLDLINPAVGKITVYDMRGKQKTSGLLEAWKNGLDVIVVEKY